MNSDYITYLNSTAWKERRLRRLALSANRCEACACNANLRVHHLTYANIFREPMNDLMTLCETCHTSIESAIVSKLLPRKGNVDALRAASIAIIHAHRLALTPLPKPKKQKKQKPVHPSVNGVVARNPSQQAMMNNAVFSHAIRTMNRPEFHAYCKLQRYSFADHSNAFALYDRWGRENGRSIPDSYNWSCKV